jgi:hypothetical protein
VTGEGPRADGGQVEGPWAWTPEPSSAPTERERVLDRLFEEVAFIAYHFGWAHDEVLSMPHWERRRWCAEISRINERMNEES